MTMSALEANPAWAKKTVTTATFAASTAYRPVRATTLGRIAVGGAGGDWTVVTDGSSLIGSWETSLTSGSCLFPVGQLSSAYRCACGGAAGLASTGA